MAARQRRAETWGGPSLLRPIIGWGIGAALLSTMFVGAVLAAPQLDDSLGDGALTLGGFFESGRATEPTSTNVGDPLPPMAAPSAPLGSSTTASSANPSGASWPAASTGNTAASSVGVQAIRRSGVPRHRGVSALDQPSTTSTVTEEGSGDSLTTNDETDLTGLILPASGDGTLADDGSIATASSTSDTTSDAESDSTIATGTSSDGGSGSTDSGAGVPPQSTPSLLTATVVASADTYIDELSPNKSFGTASRMKAGASPYAARALLRFDLTGLPADAEVTSAELRLLVTDWSPDTGAVHRVQGNWSPNSVNWNNAPSAGGLVGYLRAPAEAGEWRQLDVTSAVAAGSYAEFFVIGASANRVHFASTEGGSGPVLQITFTTVGGGSSDASDSDPLPLLASSGPTSTVIDGCEPVSAQALTLLDRRIGYAASAYGGREGCVYHVTNGNDSGPGSLREGAEDGSRWIVFDTDATVQLSSPIRVAANTTIDGRGHRVTVSGGLEVRSPNVIITNVRIENVTGHAKLDGIEVQGPNADRIWLDHISFVTTPDELLPLWAWPDASAAPGAVTVTWSRFHNVKSPSSTEIETHGILIGATGGDGFNSARTHLTLAYNVFDVQMRSPLIGDGARAHIFNNLYTYWGSSAIGVRLNGKVRSEANIFTYARRADRAIAPHGTLLGDEVLYDDGSWFPGGAYAIELNPGRVFQVPYAYGVLPANQSLADSLQGSAGATLY